MYTLIKEIANILRNTGNEKCLRKAEELENHVAPISSLHLRDLDLTSSTVMSIATILGRSNASENQNLKSISLSYNTSIGDQGAVALSANMPKSVNEIGLVNCGISDSGGRAILDWMQHSPNLKMVCIEGNNYSERLREEFKHYSRSSPNLMFVF